MYVIKSKAAYSKNKSRELQDWLLRGWILRYCTFQIPKSIPKNWRTYFSYVSLPLSLFPFCPLNLFIHYRGRKLVLSTRLGNVGLVDVYRLPKPWSQMLSALQQKTYVQSKQNFVSWKFFNQYLTAVHLETNGYCFPTTPMAGSGMWLPCGVTPQPWLHPEVTPILALLAEAIIQTSASK